MYYEIARIFHRRGVVVPESENYQLDTKMHPDPIYCMFCKWYRNSVRVNEKILIMPFNVLNLVQLQTNKSVFV